MKRVLTWIVALGFCAPGPASSGLQETSPAPVLDNGTIMYLELSKTLDAKKLKPGDEVRASLLADVLSHGKIVLRQDSKLIGHITVVQAFTKEKPESRLGVAFEKVIGKGGQEIAFNSVLLGISPAPRLQVQSMTGPAPPNSNPANPQPQDSHVPRPRAASTPTPPSYRDPVRRAESDSLRSGDDIDMRPTDIDGLSLQAGADGNRVVVSFKNNVKLESGVRLTLRVVNQPAGDKAAAQAP
jgi:hypothetical protein